MTSNRRDIQQVLTVLDDLATAMGRPFATNTQEAFEIIDAVERLRRQHHRSTTGMARFDVRFRCPRCSAEFTAANVADGHEVVSALLATGRYPLDAHRDHDLLARSPHRCDDGRIGVAELVGADPTPVEADDPASIHPDHETASG